MPSKAVIFDMDGIIFDSERAVYRGWQDVAAKHGFSDLDTVYMKCIGCIEPVTKAYFLEFYGPDFPYDEYRSEQSRSYHEMYDGGRLPLKPGIRELLEYLKEEGIPAAVASSTRTELVENQIRDAGLAQYFKVILGGESIERSKPAPDIFLKAAEMMGTEARSTFVIEDSYNGIRAAHAGGMIPVMVPDMMPPNDEMREKARYIFNDLFDVLGLFSGDDHQTAAPV